MDPQREKLDELAEKIRKAEAKPEKKSQPSSAGRIGMDFVGSVLGACILGAVMDHEFNTSPWCLLGMFFAGFAGGMISVWRGLKQSDTNEE